VIEVAKDGDPGSELERRASAWLQQAIYLAQPSAICQFLGPNAIVTTSALVGIGHEARPLDQFNQAFRREASPARA
jgi:hypothetical protein